MRYACIIIVGYDDYEEMTCRLKKMPCLIRCRETTCSKSKIGGKDPHLCLSII